MAGHRDPGGPSGSGGGGAGHHGHRSASSMRSDLLDLSRHLRQERLYVTHEKEQLQELNQKVKVASERLAHQAWVAHQQRENLDTLILMAPGSSPAICCQRANLLTQTNFQVKSP